MKKGKGPCQTIAPALTRKLGDNAHMAHDEIRRLYDELEAAERDARALVAGLSEEQGGWRSEAGTWSVAECLDHLAVANRVYLAAMQPPAADARARGRLRRRPALPGIVGGWFVRSLEPPVKPLIRQRAPRIIRPRVAPSLSDAFNGFLQSQQSVRAFLAEYADIDLAGVTFPNPFVPGIRFSLATGLHVMPAHERRHLWQAWRVRKMGSDPT